MKDLVLALVVTMLLVACSEKSDFPPEGIPFKLEQRAETMLEVDGEQIGVSIGDITGGRVDLSVSQGSTTLFSGSVGAGESHKFKLDGQNYFVECQALVNRIVGVDFGRFRILKEGVAEVNTAAKEIEKLLVRIESSDLKFVRNGEVYSGKDAAHHLRNKYHNANGVITTREMFIDKIATRSSLSGDFYKVILKNGESVLLSDWLREEK